MTTIGQSSTAVRKWFLDGIKFGPIVWSGAKLAQTAPTPAPGSTILPLTGNEPGWTTALLV